jgi:hypothetical protein
VRFGAVLLLASACSAKLLPPDQLSLDAAPHDTDRALDTAVTIDTPPDARPCTGGDVSMMDATGTCWLYFHTTPLNWADAKTACENVPSTFAKVLSADEQTFAAALVGAEDAWIGGGDMATEGTYVWYDNTPITPTFWHAGEPNNGGGGGDEDCIVLNGVRDGKWDDRACTGASGMYGYVCRFTP